MDDGRPDLVEVLERVDDLHDDGAALLLRHELVLLQVEVQVVALAVLQHRAEPARPKLFVRDADLSPLRERITRTETDRLQFVWTEVGKTHESVSSEK